MLERKEETKEDALSKASRRGAAQSPLHKEPKQELYTALMELSDKDVAEWP